MTPTSGRRRSRSSMSWTHAVSWRALSSPSAAAMASPPSAPGRKSETTNTIERRRNARPSRRMGRVKEVRRETAANSSASRIMRRTWRRPFLGLTQSSSWSLKRRRPTLSPALSAETARQAATSAPRSRRVDSPEPKEDDPETSSAITMVSSRSSRCRRMNGLPMRAVTFQSIDRTSSPGSYSRSSSKSVPRPLKRER